MRHIATSSFQKGPPPAWLRWDAFLGFDGSTRVWAGRIWEEICWSRDLQRYCLNIHSRLEARSSFLWSMKAKNVLLQNKRRFKDTTGLVRVQPAAHGCRCRTIGWYDSFIGLRRKGLSMSVRKSVHGCSSEGSDMRRTMRAKRTEACDENKCAQIKETRSEWRRVHPCSR